MNTNNIFKLYTHPIYGKIHVTIIDDEPWFLAIELCNGLGILNSRHIISRLSNDEKIISHTTCTVEHKKQPREIVLVNNAGLNHLISNNSSFRAKNFKKWIEESILSTQPKSNNSKKIDPDLISANGMYNAMKIKPSRGRVYDPSLYQEHPATLSYNHGFKEQADRYALNVAKTIKASFDPKEGRKIIFFRMIQMGANWVLLGRLYRQVMGRNATSMIKRISVSPVHQRLYIIAANDILAHPELYSKDIEDDNEIFEE